MTHDMTNFFQNVQNNEGNKFSLISLAKNDFNGPTVTGGVNPPWEKDVLITQYSFSMAPQT